MAWSDEARAAALEARRRKAKERVSFGPAGYLTRASKARALRAARREYSSGKSLMRMREGSVAAGILERAPRGSTKITRRNAFARQAWRGFVPSSAYRKSWRR
jgi:hypothetical protein